MDKIFNRTKLIFLGIFFLAVVAIWGYQIFYVMPAKRCEAAGRWWASEYRACGVPVRISTLTGRPDPAPLPAKSASTPAKPATAPVSRAP